MPCLTYARDGRSNPAQKCRHLSSAFQSIQFVDDVGPEVRRRIRDMLADDNLELSLNSLVQVQRVVLDTVKLLDRGEVNDEPHGYTDKELEELLGEGGTSDEDA
jgi:hypothetical protein